MIKPASFVTAVGLAMLVVTSLHAEVFIADVDFSQTVNPNGAWSYGYRGSAASLDFTLLTNNGAYPIDPIVVGSWYQGWYSPSANPVVPYAAQNVDSVPHSLPTTVPVIAPGQLVLHPGKGDFSHMVARWTAPSAGTVDLVAGAFTRLDITPGTSDVSIVRDGVSLYTEEISGFFDTGSFSATSINVDANAFIDFVVGPGSDDFTADATALTAVVAFTAVPEPATLVSMCLALGTVGLIATMRRRRRS